VWNTLDIAQSGKKNNKQTKKDRPTDNNSPLIKCSKLYVYVTEGQRDCRTGGSQSVWLTNTPIIYVVCNNCTFYCILKFIYILLFISIIIIIIINIIFISIQVLVLGVFHFCLFSTFLYITVLSVSEMEISISLREPPKGINKVVYLSNYMNKQVILWALVICFTVFAKLSIVLTSCRHGFV